MADFTASTAFRDLLADEAAGLNYWVTLHDGTGGFAAGDTYSEGIRGELSDGNGYDRGAKSVSLTHTGGTGGILDGANAVWTAAGGDIGPASFAALWASTGTISGAVLVSVKDSSADPQTATDGNDMTYFITNPIVIPTPA